MLIDNVTFKIASSTCLKSMDLRRYLPRALSAAKWLCTPACLCMRGHIYVSVSICLTVCVCVPVCMIIHICARVCISDYAVAYVCACVSIVISKIPKHFFQTDVLK